MRCKTCNGDMVLDDRDYYHKSKREVLYYDCTCNTSCIAIHDLSVNKKSSKVEWFKDGESEGYTYG